MKKTYKGSCHCKAVSFEADIDLEQGTNKCNCSFCTKSRNWNVIIKPDAFRLISGTDKLNDYQFGTKTGHHLFCSNCGIHSFGRGYLKEIGGDYVSIQVMCLDDTEPKELIDTKSHYADGRNNRWDLIPEEIRHL